MRLEVFPSFSVYVHLQELYAVELSRGYYQVRINFKPSSLFDYQLSQCFSSSIYDSSTIDNLTGISRTARITSKEQYFNLDSAFKCRANATKRIDRCGNTLILPFQLELYYGYSEAGTPSSAEDFRLISKRQVDIRLRTDKSVHCHRPIFFEFFAFSMVSVTIHASMICGRTVRRKLSPDPPISDKLRQFHGFVCRRFISTLLSLQDFMHRYSHVLTSPLRIAVINGTDEENLLRKELESSLAPWTTLREQIDSFNKRLSALFNQLLQLFARSKDLCENLLLEFDQQRIKQLSEAFLFSEEAVQLLLMPAANKTPNVLELVKKSDYLHFVPQLSVYVAEFDVNIEDFTIIVEQRFLPICASAGALASMSSCFIAPEKPSRARLAVIDHGDSVRPHSARGESWKEQTSRSGRSREDVSSRASFSNGRSTVDHLRPPSAPLSQDQLLSTHDGKLRKKSAPAVTGRRASQPRRLLEFCLPLGGRHSDNSMIAAAGEFEHQYEEISPTSMLLKGGNFKGSICGDNNNMADVLHVESLDQRRMTNPGAGIEVPVDCRLNINVVEPTKIPQTDGNLTAVKSYSLTEISPNNLLPEELNRQENQKKKIFGSLSSSKLVATDGSGSTRSSADYLIVNNDTASSSRLTTSRSAKLLSEDGAFSQAFQYYMVDNSVIEFVKRKESFKQQLYRLAEYSCYLYSDSIRSNLNPFICFSKSAKMAIEKRSITDVHLVIFVHGLEGTSEDLTAYRNYLRVANLDCNFAFLLSEHNQRETWSDLGKMAENLFDEITQFIDQIACAPRRISFIAHSLGGVIVRAMCGLPRMALLADKLCTLMTLGSPHCGLLYNQRTASWGISILQWWKQSACLEQLTLRDSSQIRDSFLYRLSLNGALGMFRNVLLVGSNQDLYVPGHSALIEHCKASLADFTDLGHVYAEMLANINETIVASPRHTTLVKYTVAHAMGNVSRAQQVTGRAVHIAAVDDDTFVEKLITVSAAKYFK